MDNLTEERRGSYKRPAFLSEFVEKYTAAESKHVDENAASGKINQHVVTVTSPVLAKKTAEDDSFVPYDKVTSFHLHKVLREGDNEDVQRALTGLGKGVWSQINEIDHADALAPLHVAVRRGNGFATEQLLQHGADVNLLAEDGKHAIHYAAKHYKKPMKNIVNNGLQFSTTSGKPCVKILLEHGADVNARDKFLSTPLHYASDRGHLYAVQLLIETGKADLFAKDDHLSTPLHEAAKRGHTEIVTTILESSPDRPKLMEAKDENGCTPLILACRDGYTEVAESILSFAAKSNASASVSRLLDQDNELSTPLHAAIASGRPDTVIYLLSAWEKAAALVQNRYDGLSKAEFSGYVDKRCGHGKTSLHSAAEGGVLAIVQAILGKNPDVNARNDDKATPLWIAAHRNHLEVAKVLIDSGASCELRNGESLTPLMIASREGHVDMVRLLLVRGSDASSTDTRDRNCCFLAAEHGRTAVIRELLTLTYAKSLIQSCDRLGNGPLHAAASFGEVDIVKAFISEGASLDERNDLERTPLHVAALNGRLEAVEGIVSIDRSSLNDQDENSMTALHLAALNGHETTLRTLLHLGANALDRDSKGQTALNICINEGWTKSAKILLEANPNLVRSKTRNSCTPLHSACEMGHDELVRLLLAAEADVSSCLPDGRNPLDVAVDGYHESCARALIEDVTWRDSLRNAYFVMGSKAIITPLRKLVEKMPDVAELALSKCMTWNGTRTDDKDFVITFDYEFIEDAYEALKWDRTVATDSPKEQNFNYGYAESASFELKYVTPNGLDDRERRNQSFCDEIAKPMPYSSSGELVSENHILNKMMQSKSERLLRHPTVTSLLNLKWKMFGRYVYWLNVLTYLAFFICLNVYMTTTPPRFAVNITATTMQVQGGNKCLTIRSEAQDVWGSTCVGPSGSRYLFIALVLAFSSIQLLKEVFQMIHQKGKYFLEYTNYIETTLYVLCILVFVDIDPLANDTGIREKWQWECGAFAVLLSWLNLLLYARRTSWLGIYVFMVTSVGFTFLRFATVLVFFIMGFAFGFYVLLQNQYAFYTPILAFVKTFVMMIGEMDYATIFLSHYTSSEYHDVIQYIESSNVVFIIFAVLVSLLLTNLLVGLAVDDISSVQDHAQVQRLALQVEGLLDMEYALPEFLRRRWVVRERRVFPNKYRDRDSIVRWLFEEKEMKEKHIRSTIAPPDDETDKLRAEIVGLKKELVETAEVVRLMAQQQHDAAKQIADLTNAIQKLIRREDEA